MSQQQGSRTKIISAQETVFGTVSVSSNYIIIPFVSESLRMSRNLLSSKTIRSDRNPYAPTRGNVAVEGDISFELAWQHARLLVNALGNANSGVAGTLTMKVGSLPTGLTIEKQFPDIDDANKYFQYSGCKVNSLKMAFKSEGAIECSVSVMGAKETLAAASADSSPTDLGHDPFDGFQATITDKNSASLGDITELDFTIENNLDGSMYIIDGTGQRKDIPAGTAKVSGTLKALFKDTTLYDKAVDNTESSIQVTLTRGTGDGTSGNEKLTINMNEVIFKPQAPVISGPQGVLVELPFEAYYRDDADASALTFTLLYPSATPPY